MRVIRELFLRHAFSEPAISSHLYFSRHSQAFSQTVTVCFLPAAAAALLLRFCFRRFALLIFLRRHRQYFLFSLSSFSATDFWLLLFSCQLILASLCLLSFLLLLRSSDSQFSSLRLLLSVTLSALLQVVFFFSLLNNARYSGFSVASAFSFSGGRGLCRLWKAAFM